MTDIWWTLEQHLVLYNVPYIQCRSDGQHIPFWGFVSKTVQFQGKLFNSTFLQATVAGSFLGMDLLQKFKITVATETVHVLFAASSSLIRTAGIQQHSAPPPHIPRCRSVSVMGFFPHQLLTRYCPHYLTNM
jgi:hypothetical protein